MQINPLGALLPAAGAASGSGILPSAAIGLGGTALGGGASSVSALTSELTSGLGDDASSMNMLSQLAATLGNLASSGSVAACANVGVGCSAGVSVPSPSSSGQQFRSYGSLQQAQQGSSNGDTTMASLISGADSGDAGEA